MTCTKNIKLSLDSNGLPLPGRELDRWIAENVFHRDPLNARHGLHDGGDIEYYWGYPVGHAIAPAYSTTYALFQVMEAMGGDWRMDEVSEEGETTVKHLNVTRYIPAMRGGGWDLTAGVLVWMADYPDRLHAYAHAVCCCAWKAKGGE